MKSRLIEKYLSLLLVFVMMITLMPQAAYARNREIIPTVSGNSLNMSVSNSGTLTWDDVTGATGYRVTLTQPNVSELYHWDVSDNYLNLLTEMDGYKCDSGQYTIVVTAKGVSGVDETMSYYYTSHVDKLESPNNLVWIGNKAAWDEVEGATSYNVSLYNFSGKVVTIPTTSTLYDFEASSPEDGWTFRVQALSNGTWSSERYSDYTESPAKETVVSSAVYNIGAYVYDDTLETLDSGGQVSLTTDKGTDGWSDGGYIKEATEGTTVTLNAVAAEGYEFIEWRQGTGGATISTDANYEFTATENKFLYAIFRKIEQSTTQITSANAIVTVPVAGAIPDFSPVAENSLAYTVEVDTWYLVDSKAGYPDLEADSRFEAGKIYSVRLIFTAKDGYEFTSNTTYTVNGNDTFRYGITNNYAEYEFVISAPKTYMVSYSSNGGSGTMVGDIVTENDSFTLDPCDYEAPEGYKFKAWAIGSVNGEQKQPGEKIAITDETIIYAIWEAVPEETPTKEPTETPTETPTEQPTEAPADKPTQAPTPDTGNDNPSNVTATPAPDSYTIGGFIYKIISAEKKTVELCGTTNKKLKKLNVKATVTIDGAVYKVTSVGKAAFKNIKTLKNLTIEKNVTTIGNKAFFKCKALKKVVIKAKKLKKVGAGAFKKTNKKMNVKAPKKLQKKYKKLIKK